MSERMKAQLKAYLADKQLPLRIWLGPGAGETIEQVLRSELGQELDLRRAPSGPSDEPLQGPATLVLTPEDISGSHRNTLLWLAREALPGRPIIFGGARNRDTLLEAINLWHVFRLLPSQTPHRALAVSVRKAHEALCTEVSLGRCIEDLRHQCKRLESAIEELRATQGQLIRSERLSTLGAISDSLKSRVHGQFAALDALQQAIGTLDQGQALTEPLQDTIEGIRAVAVLLQDMFALSGELDAEVDIHRESLDLLVARAVAFLRHDPDLKARKLDVECDSGAWIDADRYRMYHVVMTFLRNAIQATDSGDRIIVRTSTAGTQAIVEVEDTGQGMDKKTLEQIYTPFFSTRGKDGAGLGLRLSKSAIERQGGKLQCISNPGIGTCFRIRIPLAQ